MKSIRKGVFSLFAISFLIAALSTVAMGASGGEGNNTHCNGVGNPNSPCAHDGDGGGEGDGHGHGHKPFIISNNNTDVRNRNYNTNVNTNINTNNLQGGAATSQLDGYVGGSYENTIQGDSVKVYAPAPSAFAPALTSASETCFGSTSAGASGGNGIFGFGISFGTTWKSDDCELRMFARSLRELGQGQAALALLSQNEKVAKALKDAGVEVPASK